MMGLLIIFCVLGILVGVVAGFGLVFDRDTRVSGASFFSLVIIGILGLVAIHSTDIQRQIANNNTKTFIGVVTGASGHTISTDQKNFSAIKEYNVDLNNVKIGDLVKVKYLDADFGNYIVSVTELKATEVK